MKMPMRFWLVMSVFLLLTACGDVQPPPEIETTAVREGYRFSGEGASAFSSSQQGCTYTYVYIFASRNQFREIKGAKTESNYVDIYLSKYNECTGNGSFIYGSTSDANFDINKQLTAATLTASFRACKDDYSSGTSVCGPAELTVSWTGQGKLSRVRSNNQYKMPDVIVKEMFKGTTRNATATGSFVFRGKTYNLDFSDPSSETALRSGKGSYVVIRK